MIALLAVAAGQLYDTQPSVSFARETAIAPPLPVTAKSKFKVSIFNGTKNTIIIPSEQCSWGYSILSFELVSPSGKSHAITRKPKSWYGNMLDPVELPALGMEIRKIDFGDGTWLGFNPAILGSQDGWKIRAKVNIHKQFLLIKEGYWMGQIQSAFTPAAMKD